MGCRVCCSACCSVPTSNSLLGNDGVRNVCLVVGIALRFAVFFKVYVVVPHGWWERMVQVVCVRQCALQCVLQCVVIPQDSCNMMVQTAYTKQSKLQSVLQSVAECVAVCIAVCVATCVVAWH